MKVTLTLAALVAFTAVSCDGYGNNSPTGGGGNAPLRFNATLTGDAERPDPVTTTAAGTASFTVTTGSSSIYDPGSGVTTVTYSVTVTDLSGPAAMAHIHGPADVNTAAGIIVPLTVTGSGTTGNIISGSFTSTGNPAVSMDSLLVLLNNGNSYVNVHTAANQAGEVRGQIRR